MSAPAFSLFCTEIGRCGIAWGPRGVVRVQLPEASERATRARLVRRLPEAIESDDAPAGIARAIDAITAVLRGVATDLSTIVLDFDGVPAFERRVYVAAREIPFGSTVTYGEIAARLEVPDAAREVGRALARNPFAIVVPCHRVRAAGGALGGFSVHGGVALKRRLLAIEGAEAQTSLAFDAPID